MDHRHEGCIGRFDPADILGSARRIIEASEYSSQFRGSPAIQCIEALLKMVAPAGGELEASQSEVPK